MTDESPSHTMPSPEAHVHLEDSASPDAPSSHPTLTASASAVILSVPSDPATSLVPEASSSGASFAGHNLDLNRTVNETTNPITSLAEARDGSNEATQEMNGEASLGDASAPNPPLAGVRLNEGGTHATPRIIEPEEVEEREDMLGKNDPLGAVEAGAQVYDTTKMVEDKDVDTTSKNPISPITAGSHKNSPPTHQRDDSTNVGLRRGSPQPWDLVDPPETNGREELFSTGGPKVYGSPPDKSSVVKTFATFVNLTFRVPAAGLQYLILHIISDHPP